MDADKKYRISCAAEAEMTARLRYQYLGMCNTPTDPVKAQEQFQNYMIAKGEWLEAEAKLHQELQP